MVVLEEEHKGKTKSRRCFGLYWVVCVANAITKRKRIAPMKASPHPPSPPTRDSSKK